VVKVQVKELIAKRLISLRGSASREEVSNAVEISVSALQMYENAQRIPRDEIKMRLANHYKVSVQEVFFDNEPHDSCGIEMDQKLHFVPTA
jgi:putative transcriptional regulator